MIKIRKSNERGYFNHGWLKSFHSFSFAEYYDPKHIHFGNLRVINEDFIAPESGFGKHPHQNMEIITYVISGAISHQDSMGNSSVINAGEVQVMSAGSGVLHSEFNNQKDHETHLLQIWIFPHEKNIEPRYEQKSFLNVLREKNLVLAVSNSGRNDSLKIHQNAEIYIGKLVSQQELELNYSGKVWIQMVKGNLSVNGYEVANGDGLALENEERIIIKSQSDCEFLLFSLF